MPINLIGSAHVDKSRLARKANVEIPSKVLWLCYYYIIDIDYKKNE